jgi:hypothetical protein
MAYRNQMNRKEVLDRYWKGETSLEEETWLKEENAHPLFQYLEKSAQIKSNLNIEQVMKSNNRQPQQEVRHGRVISLKQWLPAIAASFLLIVAAFYFLRPITEAPAQQLAMLETFEDPSEAYEEVREALLLVSSKIKHTSTEVATQISKAEPYTEIFK